MISGLFNRLMNQAPKPLTTANPSLPDTAAELLDRRRRSSAWMRNNYWVEWAEVFQHYKGERDPESDPNDSSKEDPTQTSIAMPDTWALVNRMVARVTAQPPAMKFRADDPAIASRISRALMYQWDRGGVQRYQKPHVRQAALFGWSVRPWSWVNDEFPRKRRVNPTDPQYHDQIFEQYGGKIAEYAAEVPPEQQQDPNFQMEMVARLVGDIGRGNLIPIEYLYRCYEGPKTDFLFVGDCYPEPNFQSIQTSNWFIVERRRNLQWIKNFVKYYGDKDPNIVKGMETLLRSYPNGSPRTSQGKVEQQLRTQLLAVVNRKDVLNSMDTGLEAIPEWTIAEMHIPGQNPSISYVAEENVWLGKIPYPYDLDGKIAFTELVFIDDILSGIGDSHARIIRGLNALHNRQVCQRSDLIDNLLRPLMWTTDSRIMDNPDLLKRGPGFRLILTRNGGNSLGVLGEQAALAAAAASTNDEGNIMRLIQMASGESNMSQQSNVDPNQGRTATGARIMAFQQDILTKDQVDKFTTSSLQPDLEMMYLLNRSELAEPVSFDGSQYAQRQTSAAPVQPGAPAPQPGAPQSSDTPEMVTATPEDFQYDGEVLVEVGSTLADDDDTNMTKAQNLFAAAQQNPMLFNVQAAAQDFLVALGKGRDLQKYMAQPQPPAPPPEPKGSASVSIKFEMLPPEVQAKVLSSIGVEVTPDEMLGAMPGGPTGQPPGQQPQGPPPGPSRPPHPMPPPAMPDNMPLAARSLEAGRGRSPLQQ